MYVTISPVGWCNLPRIGINSYTLVDTSYSLLYHKCVVGRIIIYVQITCGRYIGIHGHGKSFDRVRNPPALFTCIVILTCHQVFMT